jgi:hypothetical protein
MGPVVGRVTPHSAVILLEVDVRCQVRCVLVDVTTNERHEVAKDVVPYVPATFLMDGLRPDRRYAVYIEVRHH